MKGYLRFIRFVLPYKGQALLNIVFNLLSIVFGLFSIALIIPFLNVLFGKTKLLLQKPESFELNADSITQHFTYYLSYLIQHYGHNYALLAICGVLVLAIFLKNLFRYLALFFMVSLRNMVVYKLREELYNHILILPLSYFSEERKGDLISRMSNDVLQVEIAIMSSLESLFKEPLTIAVYLFFLIWMSPQLTLLVFITLPVMGFFIGRIGRLLKQYSMRSQSKLGDLVSLFEETLSGARIIKAFNAQEFF